MKIKLIFRIIMTDYIIMTAYGSLGDHGATTVSINAYSNLTFRVFPYIF